MSLPTCANCGEQMICRAQTKVVNGKKIVIRDKSGKPQPVCFFPCKCKNHS